MYLFVKSTLTMTAEDGLTPGASALYSLSRVVSDSSCVITHPIRDVWALVRFVHPANWPSARASC